MEYVEPFDPPPVQPVGSYADPELLRAAQRVGKLLQLRSGLARPYGYRPHCLLSVKTTLSP